MTLHPANPKTPKCTCCLTEYSDTHVGLCYTCHGAMTTFLTLRKRNLKEKRERESKGLRWDGAKYVNDATKELANALTT